MNGGEQYSLDMALLKVREEKRKRKTRSERAVILFVVWILVFRVCGIMRVDGNSMRPACHPGDIVFFLRILPDGVGYGDAVILKDASGEYLIKRIAGLPGDVMEVDREGHLTRNGAKVQETDVIYGMSETGDSVDYPYTVPEGSYFFLGDNRLNSKDSRYKEGLSHLDCLYKESDIYGIVPEWAIKYKEILKYIPGMRISYS